PYRIDANTPASAAGNTLPPEVLSLASTMTPTKPAINPSPLRRLIFSPYNRNATMLVNITTVALLIATMPAGARGAAHAKSTNRAAELMMPMPSKRNQCDAVSLSLTRRRNGNRISAPSASRTSTSANAPKSLAAMRMNRNEPPQTAPSSSNSAGVSQVLATMEVAAAVGRTVG